MSYRDRFQALGKRLYEFSGESTEAPLAEKTKLQAGMQWLRGLSVIQAAKAIDDDERLVSHPLFNPDTLS